MEQPTNHIVGSMGLRGVWAQVGNATAMTILSVVMIMSLFAYDRMHRDYVAILERMVGNEREMHRQTTEHLGMVLQKNTEALNKLADEFRLHRMDPKRGVL